MIQRVPGVGYRVVSHTTGRNLGTYQSRSEAEARLRQLKAHSDEPAPKAKSTTYRRAQHPNN